jgi:hypothetical protein
LGSGARWSPPISRAPRRRAISVAAFPTPRSATRSPWPAASMPDRAPT